MDNDEIELDIEVEDVAEQPSIQELSQMAEESQGLISEEDGSVKEGATTLPPGATKEDYINHGLPIPANLRSPGRIVDPRQEVAWTIYLRLWREGRPNATAAGRAAGYAENTAKNMSNFKWFRDKKAKLKRSNMFSKAEKNLAHILSLRYEEMALMPDGKLGMKIDKDVLKVVADVSKTVVTHLGKDEGWSTKHEIEGNVKGNINVKSISYADAPLEVENKVVDEVTDGVQEVLEVGVKEVIQNEEKNENKEA